MIIKSFKTFTSFESTESWFFSLLLIVVTLMSYNVIIRIYSNNNFIINLTVAITTLYLSVVGSGIGAAGHLLTTCLRVGNYSLLMFPDGERAGKQKRDSFRGV